MNWFVTTIRSSIGRKFLVGLTGLALVGFLIGHIIGNLNLLRGTEAMDSYAHDLHHMEFLHVPLLPFIEFGLLAAFVIHIVLVIQLTLENKAARGNDRYAVSATKRSQKFSAWTSRLMSVSGLILILFLVVHIGQLRLKRAEIEAGDGIGVAMLTVLRNPAFLALYVLGSLAVAWHVFHGIQSAFRSLGLNHRKYTPVIEKLGAALAIALGIAFTGLAVGVGTGMINENGLGSAAAETAGAEAPAADSQSH